MTFKRRKKIYRKPTRNYDDTRYKEWRKAVRKRDGGKCQWPNCTSRGSHCHHIYRWADNPTVRFVESNGIYLCKSHHDMVSKKEEMYASMFMRIVLNKRKLDE